MKTILIILLGIIVLLGGCATPLEKDKTDTQESINMEMTEKTPDAERKRAIVKNLNDNERNELAEELMELFRDKMKEITAIFRIALHQTESELQVIIKDTGLNKDSFEVIEEVINEFYERIDNGEKVEMIFIDTETWDETQPDNKKLIEHSKFSIDSRVLPNATTVANAIYTDYVRKQELFETLGELVKVSDTDVVTDIKAILAPTGNHTIIRASLIEDNVVFAINYLDLLNNTGIADYFEQARRRHSEAIGKEAGVVIYYYSDNEWQEKVKEFDGVPMCRLPLDAITTDISTVLRGGRENLSEQMKTEFSKLMASAVVNFGS